jgi:tetratricopeptide (TPR) repeat protein
MTKGKIFKTLFLILTFMVGSTCLFAQGSEDDKKKAKKLFSEGVSYFGAGKHAQALEAFQKSYKLRPHWAIRYNLGLCYKELGMYTKAKEEFLDFLEEGGKEVKAATKE